MSMSKRLYTISGANMCLNVDILPPTGVIPLSEHPADHHKAAYGYVALLAGSVPIYLVFQCQVDVSSCHENVNYNLPAVDEEKACSSSQSRS